MPPKVTKEATKGAKGKAKAAAKEDQKMKKAAQGAATKTSAKGKFLILSLLWLEDPPKRPHTEPHHSLSFF